jgi:transcriptional regulator with XRE-family HTH domain
VTSPFVRRNRLAAELRTFREKRGMTAEELSRQIFRSRMTISKLENARCRPQIADVLKILDALGVADDEWRRILGIARDAAERGWWDSYGDAMGARQRMYADIESGASAIRGYNQMSIPGLIQSPEFTQTLIDVDLAEGSRLAYQPECAIAARLKRQERAIRQGGPHIEIILDEFVLTRLAVPPTAMAAQLRHMVDALPQRPRFKLLVLPLAASLAPGRLPPSSFLIYTFPDPDDGSMVAAENTNTDLTHTTSAEVARYERLYDRLRQATLPALESLLLLADTADRLSERAGLNT